MCGVTVKHVLYAELKKTHAESTKVNHFSTLMVIITIQSYYYLTTNKASTVVITSTDCVTSVPRGCTSVHTRTGCTHYLLSPLFILKIILTYVILTILQYFICHTCYNTILHINFLYLLYYNTYICHTYYTTILTYVILTILQYLHMSYLLYYNTYILPYYQPITGNIESTMPFTIVLRHIIIVFIITLPLTVLLLHWLVQNTRVPSSLKHLKGRDMA